MKKSLRSMVALTLVLGVVGVGLTCVYSGRLIKAAVETVGPEVLGAPVSLGLVTLAPWSGKGSLRGLVIGNPPGFKSSHALKVGSVAVQVRLSSLTSDLIVVESVVIRDPEVILESGSGGTNLLRLQKNAEESAARLGGSKTEASAGPAKSLLIKDVVVTGGSLGASVAGKSLNLPLPGVHLTDVGGKGKTPGQAAAEVLGAITGSATKAVSAAASQVVGAATDAVKNAAGALGGLFKKK